MACRNLILILGDQLNDDNPALADFDPALDQILMVEAPAEATQVWSHKARIVLFLAAMRHRAQSLVDLGYTMHYLQLGTHDFASLKQAWAFYIDQLQPHKIIVCEPGEYRLEQDLIAVAAATKTALVIKDDEHFMCSRADFKRWAAAGKQLRMEFFYRMMRKKYAVLMHEDQPEGGAWNYDAANRKAFGKAGPGPLPDTPQFTPDAITQQVIASVQQHFPNHPGSLAHFIWPVTRAQALLFLADFVAHKLAQFGDHQDAMWQAPHGQQVQDRKVQDGEAQDRKPQDQPYLWHSLLASSLNLKLLDPREVIAAALSAYQTQQLPLASVEGFVRQILGWREFVHGVYWLDMPQMAQSNHYDHQRNLPAWYWNADTQMNCQRQTVSQTLTYGYAHHIQRLMISGMFGVLAELQPQQLEAWFLAVYVDAVEWVELPNVAGMALYANGGRFTSKPYIASGAYIKRMSNYCASCKYKPEVKTGPNACPVTTLYWHFLIKHYAQLANNPRTALMTKNVDRFDREEVQAIEHAAGTILNNLDLI